jgi:serine/threonine-protein kinase HipA
LSSVSKISVKLNLQGQVHDVGNLVMDADRMIYFKYEDGFLHKGLNISPIVLHYDGTISKPKTHIFDSLYGVFADSLPDGWGWLLMDRYFQNHQKQLSDITPLDRLSLIGRYGMGALEYVPESFEQEDLSNNIDIDSLYAETHNVLDNVTSENRIDYLYQMGGSSGGARPKVLIHYNFDTNIITNEIVENSGSLPCILKFPSSNDLLDIANIEYAYYLMAIDAGIEMSRSALISSSKGRQFFITQRFDRVDSGKLHMHSAAGLLHDDFRYSTMDYGHLMDAAFRLEKSVLAYEKILRIAYFNLVTNNRDDHSKNFSFLMDSFGIWSVAPAYDLTYSTTSHGYHSTSYNGESKNPTVAHIKSLAEIFKVEQVDKIIDQVNESVNRWTSIAKNTGVSAASSEMIGKYIGSAIKSK